MVPCVFCCFPILYRSIPVLLSAMIPSFLFHGVFYIRSPARHLRLLMLGSTIINVIACTIINVIACTLSLLITCLLINLITCTIFSLIITFSLFLGTRLWFVTWSSPPLSWWVRFTGRSSPGPRAPWSEGRTAKLPFPPGNVNHIACLFTSIFVSVARILVF